MNTHVTFLNHSCFIITSPSERILCDPWFKGPAFGNGWSLLHENSHDIDELQFDYIWISHEHPDHFSIPTLLGLKKKCTFLFQETKDKKVRQFLESKGHTVIELRHKEKVTIGDLELTCIVCDGYDSSLLVRYPDGKILLNINDARVELNDHLQREIEPILNGEPVDLLTFQFSYANWAGNRGYMQIAKFLQEKTDEKNDFVISKLKPKAIMPFASFVYFSHEENFYWNENNWLEHVFKRYTAHTSTLIFPKPDQEISLNRLERQEYVASNEVAVDFWTAKHKDVSVKGFVNPVSLNQIKDSYLRFNEKLNRENTLLQLVESSQNFFLNIRITDLDQTIQIGLIESSFKVVKETEAISVSSETADFLLTQLFARGTVCINGRVSFNYNAAHMFFLFFFIPYANNIGIYFDRFYKPNKDMLGSIMRTSVMTAIDHVSEDIAVNVERDIAQLSKIFDRYDPDYDIFNNEPQNEQIKRNASRKQDRS